MLALRSSSPPFPSTSQRLCPEFLQPPQHARKGDFPSATARPLAAFPTAAGPLGGVTRAMMEVAVLALRSSSPPFPSTSELAFVAPFSKTPAVFSLSSLSFGTAYDIQSDFAPSYSYKPSTHSTIVAAHQITLGVITQRYYPTEYSMDSRYSPPRGPEDVRIDSRRGQRTSRLPSELQETVPLREASTDFDSRNAPLPPSRMRFLTNKLRRVNIDFAVAYPGMMNSHSPEVKPVDESPAIYSR
ncbi:hypothetical protein EDD18DRAFT_1360972 [Armillaria luteobubalina]|uniref:Uncharacterized protein n=1 Tax=Armillaria luteobubalina TaxID=153913 RepID=A0AA39PKE6_9AGAR|nr:hypothetical protein EDD18DRAFT_1360972 [Armillaria luteobubalina]